MYSVCGLYRRHDDEQVEPLHLFWLFISSDDCSLPLSVSLSLAARTSHYNPQYIPEAIGLGNLRFPRSSQLIYERRAAEEEERRAHNNKTQHTCTRHWNTRTFDSRMARNDWMAERETCPAPFSLSPSFFFFSFFTCTRAPIRGPMASTGGVASLPIENARSPATDKVCVVVAAAPRPSPIRPWWRSAQSCRIDPIHLDNQIGTAKRNWLQKEEKDVQIPLERCRPPKLDTIPQV